MPAAFRKARLAGQKIRVLIVDDSVVIRRLVTHALESDAELEIVGTAPNGAIALSRIPQLNPDVVTLDVEMPEMDGLETLRHIRRDHPDVRVVMFSTLTERGAGTTFDALALGADDYVTKASNDGSLDKSLERLRTELVPKIKQFFSFSTASTAQPLVAAPRPVLTMTRPFVGTRPGGAMPGGTTPAVVGIGISTGGPNALAEVLPKFPADFPLPILIVQHMPAMFTRLLAERLDNLCPLSVSEAKIGDLVEPGRVLIAPGDYHMKVAKTGADVHVRLDQGPQLNSCRPAVDALFASMAEVYGGAVTAAIMTGMGRDGLQGVETLKAKGAWVIAQDQASSVVWGMPGAIVEAGLADQIVPLHDIPGAVVRRAPQEALCRR